MICQNCNNEIDKNSAFCSYCGYKVNHKSDDLVGVTKINTALFVLFSILTLGIYEVIKIYRMTGDMRKIVPREQTVSPVIITAYIILGIIINIISLPTISLPVNSTSEIAYHSIIILNNLLSLYLVIPLLFYHSVYHTLKNIAYIAETKQGKSFKYNKFWAFLFGFKYINFVFNTYNERLITPKQTTNKQ